MQFHVVHRFARITPRKTRYVVDQIRGCEVNEALEILRFSQKRAGYFLRKLLNSAVANASQAQGVNVNKLVVREARVDCGPILPGAYMPGPMGRALPIRKRTSHIHLTLEEKSAEKQAKKPKDSKDAKPEPEAKGESAKPKAASKKPASPRKTKEAKKDKA